MRVYKAFGDAVFVPKAVDAETRRREPEGILSRIRNLFAEARRSRCGLENVLHRERHPASSRLGPGSDKQNRGVLGTGITLTGWRRWQCQALQRYTRGERDRPRRRQDRGRCTRPSSSRSSSPGTRGTPPARGGRHCQRSHHFLVRTRCPASSLSRDQLHEGGLGPVTSWSRRAVSASFAAAIPCEAWEALSEESVSIAAAMEACRNRGEDGTSARSADTSRLNPAHSMIVHSFQEPSLMQPRSEKVQANLNSTTPGGRGGRFRRQSRQPSKGRTQTAPPGSWARPSHISSPGPGTCRVGGDWWWREV